jgi:monoamine oxidase
MARRPSIVRLLGNQTLSAPKESGLRSRRQFLKQSWPVILAGGLAPWQWQCRTHNMPRVAILGAGLAGLSAAYHLEKAGIKPVLYESDQRVGGRVVSKTGWLAPQITSELGGEFIDSQHADILAFCREFDLKLLDMQGPGEGKLVGTDYFFSGRRIKEFEIIESFDPFVKSIAKDIASLPESLSPEHPRVIELDKLSIDEYLQKKGMSGWLLELIGGSFTSELGIQSGEQSSLNFLSVISTDTRKGFQIYGESDERYKVSGGNEQIVSGLHKRLKAEVLTGYHLEQIEQKATSYQLSFANGKELQADYLIVTLPFSVLRNVTFKVEMTDRKRKCIQELGYGMQSKMFIGVKERIWRTQGFSGYVLSDNIHNGWDGSQMQAENVGEGVYNLFLGAEKGLNLNLSQYDHYVAECEKVFPSMRTHLNGRKEICNWNNNPGSKGAYACYRIGQYSGIGKEEGRRAGNIFFAGEHCSHHFQGFMNGAAETGRQAASDIIAQLGG